MAVKFWVGGGTNTNWNSSPTTNWANSSGGTGNQTAPATGDDVTFDNSSGTGASVWNTAISLNSLVCNASRNTVTHNSGTTITISGGNLSLPGGVGSTYTAGATTALFTLTGTSGTQQITSNGKNFGALTLNGAGGTFQLQDNLNCTTLVNSTITLTQGTFDCQTFTVTTSQFTNNSGSTRVLKGSGAWTVNGTSGSATIINMTSAGLTVTNFTSAITCSGNDASTRTLAFGGLSLGSLTLGANSLGGGFNITGANTFSSLSVAGQLSATWPASTTNTITNAFTLAGSPGTEISFASATIGTQATISVASGTCSLSWCALRDMAFSGGATFNAYNAFDLGHNSGLTNFLAPNAARSQHAQGQL